MEACRYHLSHGPAALRQIGLDVVGGGVGGGEDDHGGGREGEEGEVVGHVGERGWNKTIEYCDLYKAKSV